MNAVHVTIGQNENVGLNGYNSESYSSTHRFDTKIPLKLVMDPRGVVQDVHSTGITLEQNNGMLSPDKCAELISALHTDAPKGKGLWAEHVGQALSDQRSI